MRKSFSEKLEKHRKQLKGYPVTKKGDMNGAFVVKNNGNIFFFVVSTGEGWDHVSVTLDKKRTPTWFEMCWVKSLFWSDDECVVQFHPPKNENINISEYCLHLWKFQGDFPSPPSIMVGPKII